MIDVLFISPGNSKASYQALSNKYSAIETPTWALLLAQSCRSIGYTCKILDVNAESLTLNETYERVLEFNPKIICFVVYGQNVNAGTTSMSGAIYLSEYLKEKNIKPNIIFVGSHVQALPIETLEKENSIDIILTNEGVYALRNLLKLDKFSTKDLKKIDGIGYRDNGKVVINNPEKIVPQDRMDVDLPGYAWDLLPFKSKPFDLYRSPMWHAEYHEEKRSPYAAIQTSLGCKFGCDFCMINLINRNDSEEVGVASNYSFMRYWSPEFIIKEFDKLFESGVETIRIVDEMFLLNPKYYLPLCELLKSRNKKDNIRLWAYSRVDTIKKPNILETVRAAGIKWLCLGIESGKKSIRLEISKGKFEDVDVETIIEKVHNSDIDVMANYIYGLPGDTKETIKETLELSKRICTSGWNTYASMALPGSNLYKTALEKNYELPNNYEGYAWLSYECLPLRNENLTSAEILKLRDDAFIEYHSYPPFLQRIKNKFGDVAVNNIVEMNKIRLKRKILGD